MTRKNESILDLLAEAPWWVSVVVSGAAFLVLRYILPGISSDNLGLKVMARTAPVVAPWVSFVLLIPAPVSAYKSWRKRKLLDSQKDLGSIRSLGWREFEDLVGEAYRRQGYTVRENAGAGPDGGVDLVLNKGGNTFLVQCKQWRSWKIGVKVVREMYGLMTAKHAHGVIIITSGMFTQDARNFAAGKPIGLVEGRQLADLVASVQQTPAKGPQPHSAQPSTAPVCPKCGAEMVLKTARQGKYAGSQFWSCSKFPDCKGLLPLTERRDR
jgi:restriction system protein